MSDKLKFFGFFLNQQELEGTVYVLLATVPNNQPTTVKEAWKHLACTGISQLETLIRRLHCKSRFHAPNFIAAPSPNPPLLRHKSIVRHEHLDG